MSLIDKLAKQSILQNQLQSQLAEMSYRAINGKRQEARNFKEGMLNIGTAYFNTPQDKLTKEMIMDYKQAEEERYFERAKSRSLIALYMEGVSSSSGSTGESFRTVVSR